VKHQAHAPGELRVAEISQQGAKARRPVAAVSDD
jgi:hypothetical protein